MIARSATLSLAFLLIFAVTLSHAAGDDPKMPTEGWVERSAGWLVSQPDVRLSSNSRRIAGESQLKPDSGISYERKIDPAAAPVTGLDLAIQADGCNLESLDYRPDDARFLFSATIGYGSDRQDIAWGKRALRFLERIWTGFPPAGIRLTYAWGCGAPVGSMYRLSPEETVFIVGGKDESGKRIESKRIAAADFEAAYGRPPKGPISDLVVRLDRPSKEKGTVKLSFDVMPTP